jgi:uncharacterized protein YndB with AHSA1/START domain
VIGELEQVGRRWNLRFKRELSHAPAKVWAALTEPDQLANWFPDQIVVTEWRVGARLEFKHDGALVFDGEVLAFEPPRLLEIRWGTDTVRFEVEPHGSGSILTLVDTIDELGKAARDGAGWHVCLDALEHWLDGTKVPAMAEEWPVVHRDYVKKFGPEASTIGPPEGWNETA